MGDSINGKARSPLLSFGAAASTHLSLMQYAHPARNCAFPKAALRALQLAEIRKINR